jgi:hypothetical protein
MSVHNDPGRRESPQAFFSARGFELRYREEEGTVWADLYARRRFWRGRVMARKYGSGTNEPDAAQSAMRRWQTEQAT